MRSVHLKVQWESYEWYNVYQNNNTFWKIFQLWIKKEKLTNEFIKNYLNECNKHFAYSHYNIWIKIDFVINELNFQLDNIFERIIRTMKSWTYWDTFPKYIDSISKIFPFIKENILWIYKNSIYLKSYWWYHTPNDLYWRANNSEYAKLLSKQYWEYIESIKWENQENRIFQNEKIDFKDELVQIFPWEWRTEEASKWNIPVKFINKASKDKIDELCDTMYEYFIDTDMEDFVDKMKMYVDEQNNNKFKELISWKSNEKDIFIRFFLLYQSKFEWFVYDTFFKKSSIFWLDYYLYENQYFLDLSDIVFVWKFEEKTKWNYVLKNKISLEMIKDMLIDWLKDWYFDHYVMKLSYVFDQENWENFQIKHIWEDLYSINDWTIKNYIELDSEEQELLKQLWSNWRKKIRWWLTLWLYSTKLEKLQEFKKQMSIHLNHAWYQIYFKQWWWENIFEHNNYLFQTMPTQSTTNLTLALNVKRFFELMPWITQNDEDWLYLWTDWYSKQPIIKQPYSKKQSEWRNIICVWSTWSWKTIFMQQVICSNFKDKFFIIDPTWTFANLQNISSDIISKKVFSLDYNPIALDKTFYSKFWVNWKIAKKYKVDLVLLLLWVDILWVSQDFKITLRLIIDNIYDEYDHITIDVIKNELQKIYSTNTLPDIIKRNMWWDWTLFWQMRNEFWKTLRAIQELETYWPIYDFLKKEEDMTKLFTENSKIVIDITELWFIDRWNLEPRDQIVFLYLLQNILSYLTFNRSYISDQKKLWKIWSWNEFPKHYLIIDEIHLMFKIESLKKLYINILRTIRNRYWQITWLSQSISDFAFSMDEWWSWSELDVINNSHIKFFFKEDDIRAYIDILEKSMWLKNKKWKQWDDQDVEESLKLKQLKFYVNEFAQIKKDRSEENWWKWPRIMLTEYYNEFFLCAPQLSTLFLENLDLIS